MPKTPTLELPAGGDVPEQPKTFWVQVVFTGIGVVPFEALNCESLSDVLMLLHREDPLDQYFDAFSESKQATRVYMRGIAGVTERTSSVTAHLIKGIHRA